ncbi:MAG: hypothetical protein QM791_04125 [Ferruginibacter sp.]
MITEIFIEGYRVDISADISSLLTFALDDVRDFASRQTTFSKTVVLPGTSNNNALFGNIFATGHSNDYNESQNNIGYNFNAAKSARCIIFQDYMQTFKGTLRMLQINKEKKSIEYEVAIAGELTNVNVALSSKFLHDLDFSEYDHFYSQTAITNSWNNQGAGYYYPLIDYGGYSVLKHDWDIHTFRPALFVKEYIDKIMAAANFRYESDLFNRDRFKSLIIPHNQKKLTALGTQVATASITATHNDPDLFDWDAIEGFDFSLQDSQKKIQYDGVQTFNGTIEVQVGGEFKFQDVTIQFFKNGVQILTKTYTYTPGSFPNFFSYTQTTPITLSNGDYITCTVSGTNQTTGYYRKISTNTVRLVSSVPIQTEVNYTDAVKINDAIPKNIRQIEFFTSIVKLFNLYVYEDRFDENKLYIKPYVDFYSTNSANSVDWTYKLNRDAPAIIKPMSELNSKTYLFNYKDDSDYWNELYKKRYNRGYGSYTFDSQFEFTSNENKVDLIFASSPLVGYDSEEKVFPSIYKLTKVSGTNSQEENIDSVIRIMQTKKITGVINWSIKNGTVALNTIDYYGYAGHLDDPDNPTNDLNFGAPEEVFFPLAIGDLSANQFNVYWSPYMAEITDKDSKLFTGRFRLTPRDILELDFSKYVYLDGELFRLNKIVDYNVSSPSDCQVELIKVINTVY